LIFPRKGSKLNDLCDKAQDAVFHVVTNIQDNHADKKECSSIDGFLPEALFIIIDFSFIPIIKRLEQYISDYS